MLIFDRRTIGNRLLAMRKKRGLTQAEVAELAGLSDRVNMRLETLLHICRVYGATPDEILVSKLDAPLPESELLARLHRCTPQQQATALTLLAVYLGSLD